MNDTNQPVEQHEPVQLELDLESDEPLQPACDLSGEGDCEACQ